MHNPRLAYMFACSSWYWRREDQQSYMLEPSLYCCLSTLPQAFKTTRLLGLCGKDEKKIGFVLHRFVLSLPMLSDVSEVALHELCSEGFPDIYNTISQSNLQYYITVKCLTERRGCGFATQHAQAGFRFGKTFVVPWSTPKNSSTHFSVLRIRIK